MAKNDTSQWDTTAGNNSDIGGINIAEGCAAANVNNALREFMAQFATARTGADTGIVTGTAGSSDQFAKWNVDGDIVGGDLDATLTSIAALGTAANKGLYTTGVDTWAEFDLTSAGRALLDDADASAQRTTLGLGTAAVAPLLDEDDLSSDSAAAVPSQQSVKAYVDAVATIGEGQTWQDVTGSRAASTSYQNTTGRPIEVAIVAISTQISGRDIQISDDDSTWIRVGFCIGNAGGLTPSSFIVPDNWYYRINGAVDGSMTWAELR